MTPWEIHGTEFGNCNCDYACPCQFNSLPNHGFCEAAVGYEIERGHYGSVKLDGLRMAAMYQWPGAVHEGNGTMQLIIGEGASEAQREALITIMSGEDTEDAATMWWIFTAMCSNKLAPLVKRIDFDVDIAARKGRIVVADTFETTGEPLRNPITGNEHRVRIDLPNGFEFTIAEVGSASTNSTAAIKINLDSTYGQFCELHLSNTGIIREAA